jgi:hypothetical protein
MTLKQLLRLHKGCTHLFGGVPMPQRNSKYQCKTIRLTVVTWSSYFITLLADLTPFIKFAALCPKEQQLNHPQVEAQMHNPSSGWF